VLRRLVENAAVVAVGQFLQRRAMRAPPDGLFSSVPVVERGSAHMLSAGFGAVPVLCRPGADQIGLHIGKPPSTATIQRPGAGAGVTPTEA
jgi:hypothetical protein